MGIFKFIKNKDLSSSVIAVWKFTFALCCYYWVIKFWNNLGIFHLSPFEGFMTIIALQKVFSGDDSDED